MKPLHFYSLLLLPCISLLCAAVPVIAGGWREARALLKWKASLAGVDETLSSWNLSANSTRSSPCNWAFIACNTAGEVTKLSINYVSVNGTLAELDFSAFPRLETLLLEQNDLYGTIPEGIGNLTSLTLLRIMNNKRLTGSIPRSIGQLKQLVVLDLGILGLDGAIPAEIGNLTRLEDLSLGGNSLTGSIPPEIGRLEKVTSLYLSGNNLTGSIPREIGNITELQIISLADNHLEGELPLTLSRLVKLTALFVSNNQLEGHIATQLGNKSSLNDIEIFRNKFSRLFTQSICTRGGALQNFAANSNEFEILHDLNFQNCTSLASLDFTANNILGDITEWLGTLPKQLTEIYFTQNQLYGALPQELSEFNQLTVLELDENEISGVIPSTLGNITGLTTLNLRHNLRTGAIPTGLGELFEIYSLDLSYNYLSGPMPLTLRNLSKLALLDLSNCSLTGHAYGLLVADRFNSSSNLSFPDIEILAIASNYISGTIPIELCKASNLDFLDLSNNALYGDLLDCLWDLPILRFMDLSRNSFSGSFPISSTSIIILQSLHLASNQFNGTFPLLLRNCSRLITLDIGVNNFSGEIPSWIAESLPKLRFLRLSSNMFDGIIPQQIFKLRQLQLLDLSHNKLKGPVPVDFTNLVGMTQEQQEGEIIYDGLHLERIQLVWKNGNYIYSKTIAFVIGIDLSCNSLSQWIPEGLTTLHGLRYLNLSKNNLTGGIPEDIGNLAMLESLDLSWNQISGQIPPSFADLKFISSLNLSNNGLSGRIPTGSQLQTLTDPSIYGNNPGLCGLPLKECTNATASTHNQRSQDGARETLWLYCSVVAGFIFGSWLSWGILFCNKMWRYALYQYVDNMQEKIAKKKAAYRRSRART